MKSVIRLVGIMLTLALYCPFVNAQSTQSQGRVNLNFSVQDNQGKPLENTEIEFVEINSRLRILKRTDSEGNLSALFDQGHYWQINIKEIRDYYFWQFEVVPGKSMNLSKRVTYDFDRYARETRPAVDRSKIAFKNVSQKIAVDELPKGEMAIVKLQILRADKQALTNFPVALTCYKTATIYETSTNPAGFAVFKVPSNSEYEIDIDGIESFEYIDLPDRQNWRQNKTFTYEPTVIQEKVVRDTIMQILSADQAGTSGSVIANITFKGGPDKLWRNEPVFLEVLGEKKWYRGTTDVNGNARFLLPKGKRYMIHGRFEYDLDVIDLRRRRGIGYSNKAVTYRPKDKYQYPEKFIPRPEELVVDAFRKFLEKQYPIQNPDQAISPNIAFTGPINAQSKEAVLRLVFESDENGNKDFAPPLNIALVIDKSGSMSGHDRIDQLKLSLIDFVNQLRENDIVSLVIFEGFPTVLIPSQKVGGNRKHLIELIERLEADGSTNIFEGMKSGYEELLKNYKSGITNRLILLTDGMDGTPIEDFAKLQKPFTDKGIDCSAVGVGENYNAALLQLLATANGGVIEHIGVAKEMRNYFVNQVSSLLYPVAKDVQIEIIFNKNLEYKQFYGFPIQEKSSHRLKIKLENAYAGLSQIAFLRFAIKDPTPEIVNEPVIVNLRYTDLRNQKIVEKQTEVKLVWAEGAGEIDYVVDQQEKKLYTIAVMNQSLKAMSDRFHSGDVMAAKKALEDGLETLKKVNPSANDEDIKNLRGELEKYLDVLIRQH